MKVICFDPGSNCGWAFSDGVQLEFGTQTFDLRRGESPGMRFLRFTHWLNGLPVIPELVLFEQAHHRGGAATELTVGMMTRIMEWAVAVGAEYKGVHTSTLKKHVIGSGRADKADMGRAVLEYLSVAGANEHENDALALIIWFRKGMPEGERKASRRSTKTSIAAVAPQPQQRTQNARQASLLE